VARLHAHSCFLCPASRVCLQADQLGDRIGIMHHGEMKCCGTPLFLKAKYGVGYCMTLVKDPHAKVDEVTKLVQTQVPEATILSSVGSELSYSLPFTASEVFPQLLGQLDLQMSRLGIVNYGLSVTTLEEVFIKVAEEEEHKPGVHNSHEEAAKQMLAEARQNSSSDLSHKDAMNVDLTKHSSSWCDHFMALLAKRWHIQKRDKKALCCQFLVPLILLALGMGLLRIPPNLDFPTLEFQTGVGSAYNQPNRMAFNYGLDQALWGGVKESEGMMEMLSAGGLGTGAGDLYNFSYSLLVNRTQYEQSRYGAFFGTQLDQRPYGEEKGAWEFTVLTNASATHGMPTWANLGHQALLRNLTGNSSASITGNIHPFSWTHRQKLAIQSLNGVFASIVISLAFTFIPASFAVFIVSEREYKSKHLQLISGVSMSSYWVANFVWDFVAYCIPAALSCGIIYAYQNPELTKNMDVLVVTFLTYGLSIIPFTYVCSFLFTSVISGRESLRGFRARLS
jgi:ATP-binding cassette subfamily A (ABC1) protein 3